MDPPWTESYAGGSPEAEEEIVRRFAEQINEVQRQNRKDSGEPIRRAFHAKLLAGVGDARVEIQPRIPADMQRGMLVPGAAYPATVRLSSASGLIRPDDEDDLRGIAVGIDLGDGRRQDLLMTNAPASHARDARQFVVTALTMAGGRRLGALPLMMRQLGPFEAVRIMLALRKAASRPIESLAAEAFWSRGPFAFGPLAIKMLLRPMAYTGSGKARSGHDFLRDEFVERLRREDVRYVLQVQRFVDERLTPIEDGAVEWKEEDAPPESVATLILPRQDLSAAVEREGEIDAMAFIPWNADGGFRPIGGLNRARRLVYPASVRLRTGSS